MRIQKEQNISSKAIKIKQFCDSIVFLYKQDKSGDVQGSWWLKPLPVAFR